MNSGSAGSNAFTPGAGLTASRIAATSRTALSVASSAVETVEICVV